MTYSIAMVCQCLKCASPNVHHETALKNLFYLQEAEPETYQNASSNRLPGIDAMGKLKADFFAPDVLPAAFSNWKEYRDFLFDLLITDSDWRRRFVKEFAVQEELFADTHLAEKMYRVHVNSILVKRLGTNQNQGFQARARGA